MAADDLEPEPNAEDGTTPGASPGNSPQSGDAAAFAEEQPLAAAGESDETTPPTVGEATNSPAPSDSPATTSLVDNEVASDELPVRVEVGDGVFVAGAEPFVAGLTVTLEPLDDATEAGTERYAIRVENPGEERLAGPVAIKVEIDNGREFSIESSDRWRCAQLGDAVECVLAMPTSSPARPTPS